MTIVCELGNPFKRNQRVSADHTLPTLWVPGYSSDEFLIFTLPACFPGSLEAKSQSGGGGDTVGGGERPRDRKMGPLGSYAQS